MRELPSSEGGGVLNCTDVAMEMWSTGVIDGLALACFVALMVAAVALVIFALRGIPKSNPNRSTP